MEDIQLPQQEKRSQGDEHHCANGRSVMREHRPPICGRVGWRGLRGVRVNWTRRHWAGRGRRVGVLPLALRCRLVCAPRVGRLPPPRRRRLRRPGSPGVCIRRSGAGARLREWLREWRCAGLAGRGLAGPRLSRILRVLAQVQPVAHVVQSQRIGHRQSVAQGFGGVEGLKRLVENPCGNEDAEDPRDVGHADQHGEDHHVDESLEKLPVVHGADAGNQTEHGCRSGVRCARRDGDKGLLIGLPGGEAGLAEHLAPGGSSHAVGAEGLAAGLTKGGCGYTSVVYAVHFVLLSRTSNAEPPDSAGPS